MLSVLLPLEIHNFIRFSFYIILKYFYCLVHTILISKYICKYFVFLISNMEKCLLLKFTGCMETHYILNIFMLNIIQNQTFWEEMNTPKFNFKDSYIYVWNFFCNTADISPHCPHCSVAQNL